MAENGRLAGISGYPLTDYPLAILVALNFYAAAHAHRLGRVLLPLAKPIRFLASFTLTIYLFHLPLLLLFWDVLHTPAWICLVALFSSIVGIGYLTEHRRRDLRALLAFMLESFSRAYAPHPCWRAVILARSHVAGSPFPPSRGGDGNGGAEGAATPTHHDYSHPLSRHSDNQVERVRC